MSGVSLSMTPAPVFSASVHGSPLTTSVQCQRPSIHSAPTVSVGLHANQITWPQPVQMFSASLHLYLWSHHPTNRLAALTSGGDVSDGETRGDDVSGGETRGDDVWDGETRGDDV